MSLTKATLSEQIYQILRNDILTQQIPCGEKLTLKLLMERFQVSSTPSARHLPAFPRISWFLIIPMWGQCNSAGKTGTGENL